MSISEWSTTAADNASAATGINWAEGQAPSTVNDSARQMMADVATWYAQLVGAGMLFAQAAAPTGWTKDATAYDHALRLTNGTGAATAGTVNFSTVFAITATAGHALTAAENGVHAHTASETPHSHSATQGPHTHNYDGYTGSSTQGSGGIIAQSTVSTNALTTTSAQPTITVGNAQPIITVANSGSGTAHSHDIDLQVKYYDLIRCTKDA